MIRFARRKVFKNQESTPPSRVGVRVSQLFVVRCYLSVVEFSPVVAFVVRVPNYRRLRRESPSRRRPPLALSAPSPSPHFSTPLSTHSSQKIVARAMSLSPSRVYDTLSATYGALAFACLVQLARASARSRECATQKVFHALCFFTCASRCFTFALRDVLSHADVETRVGVFTFAVGAHVSAFATLAVFWSDVYRRAAREREGVRPSAPCAMVMIAFGLTTNVVLLALIASGCISSALSERLALGASSVAAVAVAYAFALYGSRLLRMLSRFPVDAMGRRRKMWEVAAVASTACASFATRARVDVARARAGGADAAKAFDLAPQRAFQHAMLCVSTELVVLSVSLVVLRKLPPKKEASVMDEDDVERPFAADAVDDESDDDDDDEGERDDVEIDGETSA